MHSTHGLCDNSPALKHWDVLRRGTEIPTCLPLSNKRAAVSPALSRSRENHGMRQPGWTTLGLAGPVVPGSGRSDCYRAPCQCGSVAMCPGGSAEPGATAGSWEAAPSLQMTGERLTQVLKRTNGFELSLPLKPQVWSGNFPLVYTLLSLLLCCRIIWFHEGSGGKESASCREGCY